MPATFEHLQQLRVDTEGGVTHVTLARPEVRNAFGPRLIEELGSVFTELSDDPDTHVIVLAGDGPSFSAGADINWMRETVTWTRQENVEDATRLALMLEAIKRCDKPVVCRVHGHAIGGALGLIAVSDYVIAEKGTAFAFSEVKHGIVPAVISPFVLRRIGLGHARALFITGERFDSCRAERIGLVHVVAEADEMDAAVNRVLEELLTAAPGAIAVAKQLANEVAYRDPREVLMLTAETIASKRTDPEGQEGLGAFIEKRKPEWMDDAHEPAWLAGAKR
ncbi:MAG: enoyl-CoA hydratase/isomerase family protein [Thermoleophilia bacterium]|nr:enoyl-CoA hydratase/isomerase family protein [Thermoleophilia bacterium]